MTSSSPARAPISTSDCHVPVLHIYNFFSLLPFWSRPSAALTWTIVKSPQTTLLCLLLLPSNPSSTQCSQSDLSTSDRLTPLQKIPQLSISLADSLNSFLVCSTFQASGPTVSTFVIASFKTLFKGPKYFVLIFCLGFPYWLFQLPE